MSTRFQDLLHLRRWSGRVSEAPPGPGAVERAERGKEPPKARIPCPRRSARQRSPTRPGSAAAGRAASESPPRAQPPGCCSPLRNRPPDLRAPAPAQRIHCLHSAHVNPQPTLSPRLSLSNLPTPLHDPARFLTLGGLSSHPPHPSPDSSHLNPAKRLPPPAPLTISSAHCAHPSPKGPLGLYGYAMALSIEKGRWLVRTRNIRQVTSRAPE